MNIIYIENEPEKVRGCWRFRPPKTRILYNPWSKTAVIEEQAGSGRVIFLMHQEAQEKMEEIMKMATVNVTEITSRLALRLFNDITEVLRLISEKPSLRVSLMAWLESFVQERFESIVNN